MIVSDEVREMVIIFLCTQQASNDCALLKTKADSLIHYLTKINVSSESWHK